MAPEPHDWNLPASLRALLWWPPVALVVALLDPHAAARTIAVAGVVLAVLGVLVAAVARVVARRLADPVGIARPPLVMPDAAVSPQVEQQAA